MDNLDDIDLANFRKAAKLVLGFSEADINTELRSGRLIEVSDGKTKI